MPKQSISSRVPPDAENERRAGHPDLLVAGVDEVGRGCLAGPVVAAAVILPSVIDLKACSWLAEVTDSKLVPPQVREELAPLIRTWAKASAIGVASVEEIDRINIHAATHLAMQRALDGMSSEPAHVLVDGKHTPKDSRYRFTAIVKGDQKALSIACASILAKVWRDSLMRELDLKHPGYGFGIHKGYSTAVHVKALRSLGPCEIHRKSFAPVSELLSGTPPAL